MKKKLLKSIVFLLYILLVLEIVLRIPFISDWLFISYKLKNLTYSGRLVSSSPSPLYWTITPNTEPEFEYPSYFLTFKKPRKVKIKINSQGFRGPDFNLQKPLNTIRIAFLGDSFTFGWGLDDRETFSEKICGHLNNLNSRYTFECLNFGMPATNIYNNYHIFINEVIRFNPDIVILGLTINDMEEPPYIFTGQEVFFNPRLVDFFEGASVNLKSDEDLYKTSYIIKLIKRISFSLVSEKKTIEYYYLHYSDKNAYWLNENLTSLLKIKAECEKRAMPFLVLYFPILYKLHAYPFNEIHLFMRSFFANNNIAFIDFLDEFKNLKDRELWVHSKDKHPNDKATSIIAQKTVELLMRRYLK